MSITKTWNIANAEYSTGTINGHEGVIVTAHFVVQAADSAHPDLQGQVYGTVDLEHPAASAPDFIPREEVTKADLIAWTKAALDKAVPEGEQLETTRYENQAVADLNRQITPPTATFVPAD